MKRHALLIGLGLALVLVFLGNAAKFYQIWFIQQLEDMVYGYRLRLTMPRDNLQRMLPECKLYKVYAERVAYLRDRPPDTDWDGVFVFQTK